MNVEKIQVEAFLIRPEPDLDHVMVFWQDFSPGRGQVTIVCYGSAWTAYFGAMYEGTIRGFFRGADVSYLVNKMSSPRATKASQKWLSRIVEAVKMSLAETEVAS